MLRFSSKSLLVSSPRFAFRCTTTLLTQQEYGTTPFASKLAHKRQQDAGVELAQNFAAKFAEHHKSKTESDIEKELKLREKANFKDATNHVAKDEKKGTDGLRKRLIFQSRYRGMAELDLILGSFAHEALPNATQEELIEYDAILRELDTDLFHWLVTIPGRKKDGASANISSTKQTAQSILSGTSDYSDADKGKVLGSTPTVEDEFIEPKEMLEAEWHRRDDISEALQQNSMWKKLVDFIENNRVSIVGYR